MVHYIFLIVLFELCLVPLIYAAVAFNISNKSFRGNVCIVFYYSYAVGIFNNGLPHCLPVTLVNIYILMFLD